MGGRQRSEYRQEKQGNRTYRRRNKTFKRTGEGQKESGSRGVQKYGNGRHIKASGDRARKTYASNQREPGKGK